MRRVLENLKPADVFCFFEEISQIPRGSGNEKQISDFLVAFARERNYHVVQDANNNVLVDVPATEGYETHKKIILQGHVDMVCQKTAESNHDFLKDPIDLYIDGEFIKARGTTLGADDGFAVAMLMAIMDSKTLPHAALQIIFTTDEESGFNGAQALDGNLIDGQYLIGLDCSRDDIIMVSCSGSSMGHVQMPVRREMLDAAGKKFFQLTLTGLRGGHSGNMIHLGRANSLKVIGEVISYLMENEPSTKLCDIACGTLFNVIPNTAKAIVCCDESAAARFRNALAEVNQKLSACFSRTDPDFDILCDPIDCNDVNSCIQAEQILNLLHLFPAGANSMMDDSFTLAESSCNPAILSIEQDVLDLSFSIRSNSEYLHDMLLKKVKLLADLCGGEYVLSTRKAAWEFNPKSKLMIKMKELYEEQNGSSPEIKKIHASVEGSLFIEKMKKRGLTLDVVNIGCNNLDVHTPQERLQISSVAKTYNLLTKTIASLD